MKNKLVIETITEKSKIAAGATRTVDLLVRLAPPERTVSEKKRPKMNIGIALDRSGSMGGEKMVRAREAAKFCVDQMLPTDVFSAVIFDDVVDVLFTSQTVSDREALKRGLDRIEARNSTALHEGWVKAGLQVSEKLDRDAINRILLITDGQANVGETNVDRIVDHARNLAHTGVSTTTIGIGDDFNEDLLMPMAEAGQGNAWHVKEAAEMARIFETELHGLLGQYAHNVTLSIKPASGATLVDVLNDFETDTSGRYKIPNLIAGSPLEIIVRLKVGAHSIGDKLNLLDLDLRYIDQETGLPEVIAMSHAVEFAAEAELEHCPSNLEVARVVQLLMNARARQEAMNMMDRQDYSGAESVLKSVAVQTQVLFAAAPCASLQSEMADLDSVSAGLADRSKDKRSRKLMAYARESLRKSR